MKYRPAGEQFTLTVYSNAPSIELLCNGTSIAKATETGEATGVVWKFPVTMGDTETTFKAITPNGNADEIIILPLQSE